MKRRSCNLVGGCHDLKAKTGNTFGALRTCTGARGGGGGCSKRSEMPVSSDHENLKPFILMNEENSSKGVAAEVVRLKRIRKC
jgi:hypothetical protein